MNAEELKEKILKKLEEVSDPEVGVDIVNLGLVYRVDIDKDLKKAHVVVTLTSITCPVGGIILESIRSKLSEIEELDEISVELVFDPPWTPEMMSKKAKLMLGYL